MAEISKEEQDAADAKQRVIDRLVARAGVQDLAPDLQKKTPAEIQSGAELKGKASPKDFIEPYYGTSLLREILKAKHYNRDNPTLKEDSYGKIYQDIPVSVESRAPSSYNVTNPKVTLTGTRGKEINKVNADTLEKWMQEPEGSDLRKQAEEAIFSNAYSKAKDYADSSQTAEHEFGHHYARPQEKLDISSKAYPDKHQYTHLSGPSEFLNGIGELQRATFKATGKRFEDPEDFKKFIQSGAEPDYLTPESSRAINHLRMQIKADADQGNYYLNKVSKLVPALVQNEEPKSFQDAIEKRLS